MRPTISPTSSPPRLATFGAMLGVLFAVLLAGCGDAGLFCGEGTSEVGGACVVVGTDSPTSDAGLEDAAAGDAESLDAESADAETPDGSPTDAGVMDAEIPDAATPDSAVLADGGTFDAFVPRPPAADAEPTRIEIYGPTRVPTGVPITLEVAGFVGMYSVEVDPSQTTWSISGGAATVTDEGTLASVVASAPGAIFVTVRVETSIGSLLAQSTLDVVGPASDFHLALVLDHVPADTPTEDRGSSYAHPLGVHVGVGAHVRATTWAVFTVPGTRAQYSYIPPSQVTLSVSGPARSGPARVIADGVGLVEVTSRAFGLSVTEGFDVHAASPPTGLRVYRSHGHDSRAVSWGLSTRRASRGPSSTLGDGVEVIQAGVGRSFRVRPATEHGAFPDTYHRFLPPAEYTETHTDATGILDITGDEARWVGEGVVRWDFEGGGFVYSLIIGALGNPVPGRSIAVEPDMISMGFDHVDSTCVDVSVFLVDSGARRALTPLEQLALRGPDATDWDYSMYFSRDPADTSLTTHLCPPTRYSSSGSVEVIALSYDFLGMSETVTVTVSE